MPSNRRPWTLVGATPAPALLDWLATPETLAFGLVAVVPTVGLVLLLGSLREPEEEPARQPVEHCPACGTPVGDDHLYCEDCRGAASSYRK